LFTASVDIVQCYCFMDFLLLQKKYIYCNVTINFKDFIGVTTNVNIVQWYCVVCGVNCGYSNSSYSAMLLCYVLSFLWLQQQ